MRRTVVHVPRAPAHAPPPRPRARRPARSVERGLRRLRLVLRHGVDGRGGRGEHARLVPQGADRRVPGGDAALSRRTSAGADQRRLHGTHRGATPRRANHARGRARAQHRTAARATVMPRAARRRRAGRMAGAAGARGHRRGRRHPARSSARPAFLLVAGGVRRARQGTQAAATRILLPAAADEVRCAHGRRRAGRRPVELRRREPRRFPEGGTGQAAGTGAVRARQGDPRRARPRERPVREASGQPGPLRLAGERPTPRPHSTTFSPIGCPSSAAIRTRSGRASPGSTTRGSPRP